MRTEKSAQRTLVGSEGKRAVSPVIGVILMVAMTVLLAALIAMFVSGIGGDQTKPAQAGYQIENNTDDTDLQVTVLSLGSNTKTIKCVENGADKNATSSGGTTITCPSGSTLIGINNKDEKTVIEPDIED